MQQLSTHNLEPPTKKRGGWGKKKRYDVTLTQTAVEASKAHEGNLSGLLDGLLATWLKRKERDKA